MEKWFGSWFGAPGNVGSRVWVWISVWREINKGVADRARQTGSKIDRGTDRLGVLSFVPCPGFPENVNAWCLIVFIRISFFLQKLLNLWRVPTSANQTAFWQTGRTLLSPTRPPSPRSARPCLPSWGRSWPFRPHCWATSTSWVWMRIRASAISSTRAIWTCCLWTSCWWCEERPHSSWVPLQPEYLNPNKVDVSCLGEGSPFGAFDTL